MEEGSWTDWLEEHYYSHYYCCYQVFDGAVDNHEHAHAQW